MGTAIDGSAAMKAEFDPVRTFIKVLALFATVSELTLGMPGRAGTCQDGHFGGRHRRH